MRHRHCGEEFFLCVAVCCREVRVAEGGQHVRSICFMRHGLDDIDDDNDEADYVSM